MSDTDSSMSRKIKEALEDEMQGSSLDINVDVKEGYASLSGIVDTLSEKRAAEEIATAAVNLKGIENHITISTDGTISDKEVEAEVIQKLRDGDFHEELLGVGASVQKGTAVLEGSVRTLRDKKLAVNQAEKALGVKDVVSNIKVESAGSFDDVSIFNKLTQRLAATGISVPDLDMAVTRGVVHLHGYVNNQNEMELASEIAQEIEGVTGVHNKLKLR